MRHTKPPVHPHIEFHPRLGVRERELLLQFPHLILPQDLIRKQTNKNKKPPERETRSFSSEAVSGASKETTVLGRKAKQGFLRNPSASRSTRLGAATMSELHELHMQQMVDRARRLEDAGKPSGADRRRYNPEGYANAQTRFGTRAYFGADTRKRSRVKYSLRYLSPWMVLPCVERVMRREVMFALRKAGRGHHARKRRGPYSFMEC